MKNDDYLKASVGFGIGLGLLLGAGCASLLVFKGASPDQSLVGLLGLGAGGVAVAGHSVWLGAKARLSS